MAKRRRRNRGRTYRKNPNMPVMLLGAAGAGLVGWHFYAKQKEQERLEAEAEAEAIAAAETAAEEAAESTVAQYKPVRAVKTLMDPALRAHILDTPLVKAGFIPRKNL